MDTIKSQQSQKFQILGGIEIGVFDTMMTINAQKLISPTISPVPFETVLAKLRSFPGIFAYYLNPQFFTFSFQQSLRVTFRLTKEEKETWVKYCELEARKQNDVFREHLRSIKRKLSKKIKKMDN